MRGRFRPPMVVFAAALLGLIAVLATFQYRWLGQISAAERERMRANLSSRTTAFANDVDQELTRAYLTFQLEPMQDSDSLASRIVSRYQQWQGTSRYPKLLENVFIVTRQPAGEPLLQRFNPTTGFIEPASWPAGFEPIRAQVEKPEVTPPASGTLVMRSLPSLWDSIPAIVVPSPVLFISSEARTHEPRADVRFTSGMRVTVLALDRTFLLNEMLPTLARQHFSGGGSDEQYEMTVVSTTDKSTVFSTARGGTMDPATADAQVQLFQVRTQDFGSLAAEVRRFTTFSTQLLRRSVEGSADRKAQTVRQSQRVQELVVPREGSGSFTIKEAPQISILMSHAGADGSAEGRKAIEAGLAASMNRVAAVPARWQLLVKHPAGSLEAAIGKARRRNLAVSSGILAILGISIGFLVVSTRRAQELARQQMEFVAAVSHELRTPLAVIRSAADNLAEGVVHEHTQVRQYGELVRGEGRRLSEMVEQILELAGIQSGQRGFALRPVALLPLVHDVLRSLQPLIEEAGIRSVEVDVPDTLPPVLGDEQALRRVVQNLVGNAIKYGRNGGWIGIRARATGRDVQISVADRGIGIDPAEQARIFEPFYRAPDVIEAQIQGAGLGLSLVQRTVQAHGGRIDVVSAVGQGSEFTVHLPAASEASSRTASAADHASAAGRASA